MRARTAAAQPIRRLARARSLAAAGLLTVALPATAVASDPGRHTVQPGETASEIARDAGTTLRALAEANGLDDVDRIVIGQVLIIPGSAPAAPATVVHVVAPGDTLGGIARHYGTSSAAIASANGITNPNLVRIGQRLTIPAGSGAAPVAAAAPVTHTVAEGENLAVIAGHYGTTVGAIVSANSISNPNVVRIGQVLTIPPGRPGGSTGGSTGSSAYAATGGADGHTGVTGTHVVASGETLAGIARRYGVEPLDLAAANGILPPHNLYAGARIRLDALNRLPNDLAACPLPSATYVNDWGFPRSGGRAHEGNDLFAPRGTPIAAPASGTVSFATGSIGGRQFRLQADDGTIYLGSHMEDFGRSGRVSAGDTVGYVGSSGNAAGGRTHLHFEVHPDGGAAMNPYPLIRAAC